MASFLAFSCCGDLASRTPFSVSSAPLDLCSCTNVFFNEARAVLTHHVPLSFKRCPHCTRSPDPSNFLFSDLCVKACAACNLRHIRLKFKRSVKWHTRTPLIPNARAPSRRRACDEEGALYLRRSWSPDKRRVSLVRAVLCGPSPIQSTSLFIPSPVFLAALFQQATTATTLFALVKSPAL